MIKDTRFFRTAAALSGLLLCSAARADMELKEGFEGLPIPSNGTVGAAVTEVKPVLFFGKIYHGKGKAKWGISADAHSGKQSVYLENLAFNDFGEINNGLVCADSDGVIGKDACVATANTTYSFSFFIKGDTQHVELYCEGWGAGGRQALWTSLSERMTPTKEWVRYDGIFKTLPTTTRFALILLARGMRERGMELGTRFYLDDVTIAECTNTPPPQPAAAKRPAGRPGKLACYPVGEWFKVYKDGAAHDGQTWHMAPGSVDRLGWSGWDGKRVRVSGARNDYVDFQLILKAEGDVGLRAIEVSDLKGPRKALLSRNQVELFQQWYVDCPRPSDGERAVKIDGFDTVNDGNRAGVVPAHLPPLTHMLKNFYPDGTLPIRNPTSYIPADLPYQGIWVSVYIPPIDSPAGVYTGTITLQSDAENRTVRIPLEVVVEDRCVPLVPYYRAYYPGGDLSYLEDGTPVKGGASPRYAELHLRSRMITSGYGVSYHVTPTWETDKEGNVRLTRFTQDWQEKYVEFSPIVLLSDPFSGKGGVDAADAKRRHEAALQVKQLIAACKEKGWWSDALQRGQYEYTPEGPSYLTVPPGRKPVTVTIQPDEPHTDEQHALIGAKHKFFSQEVDPDLLISNTGHLVDKIAASGTRIPMPHYGYNNSNHFYSQHFKDSGAFKADLIWPYDNDAWRVDCAPSRMKKLVLGYPEMSGSFAGNYSWHCAIAQRNAIGENTPTWRSNIPVGVEHKQYGQHACTLLYSGQYVGFKGPVRSMNLQVLRNACEVYDLNMLGAPKFTDATDPVKGFAGSVKDNQVQLTWKCAVKTAGDLKGFNLWGSSQEKWGEGGRAFPGPYNPVFDCERLNRPDLIPPQPADDYTFTAPAAGARPFHYILEMIDANNNARYHHTAVK